MLIHLNDILPWLEHYKYWVLLPLVMIEGPIVTLIAGFLGSLGQLNLFIAYPMIVCADAGADCLYYLWGRLSHGEQPGRLLRLFGITASRIAFLREQFRKHPKKIFIISKLSHGVGAAPLFAAGLVKFPFDRFLLYNLILTLVKSLLLLFIGFYFGQAFAHIQTYLDYAAIAGLVGFIILYIIFLRFTHKLGHENTDQ